MAVSSLWADQRLYIPLYALPYTPAGRLPGGRKDLDFRTKPQLGLELVASALEAEVPARWVVGDEVYGSDGKLRRALEGRSQAYVLAVRGNEKPSTWPPYGSIYTGRTRYWEVHKASKDRTV